MGGNASVPLAIEQNEEEEDDGGGNSDSEGDDGVSGPGPRVDDDDDSESLRDSEEDEEGEEELGERKVRRLRRLKEKRKVSAGEKLSTSLPRHHEVMFFSRVVTGTRVLRVYVASSAFGRIRVKVLPKMCYPITFTEYYIPSHIIESSHC